jgi:hypothetical protein
VIRQGSLVLTEGYCVDLDTAVPNWSVSDSCGTLGAIGNDGDIRELNVDRGLYGPNNTDFAILGQSQPGTFSTCDSVTNYSSSIDAKSVVQGLRFCVRTTSGNFALMQVISAKPDGSFSLASAAFNVTVWKGAGNSL